MHEPVEWSDEQCPSSPRFQDVYRSRSGGWLQAQTVFLGGCQLPAQWRGMPRFTVLETGFGLGLNFLATWAAWEADPQRCTELHFVSVEAYPVSGADLLRSAQTVDTSSAAAAPGARRLEDLVQELAWVWCDVQPGLQTFHLAQGRVHLTLAIGQVLPMLAQLDCTADAVYLDGFNPACNPQMWSQPTIDAVAGHCRAGTTLATYSAAAAVRTVLRNAGFVVRRRPGLPPKWHRLEARYAPA